MAVVTALFMVPTALVFPALLRKANTPPSSVTLMRPRQLTSQRRREFLEHLGRNKPEQGFLTKAQEENVSQKEEQGGRG